jgi:hypothetical protein
MVIVTEEIRLSDRGMDKFFKTILAILARLASELVYLLTNPELYSHLASWRVVIRTLDFSLLKSTVRKKFSLLAWCVYGMVVHISNKFKRIKQLRYGESL